MQFDLDDTVGLLSGERHEEFPHERVIRLIQLQTWIWFPEGPGMVENAERLAATAILNNLEQDKFREWDCPITMDDLHTLSQSDEYRNLFDAVIAPGGGWSAASITGMGADVFDERLGQHSSHGPIIADLIEYRLRAVLNGKSGKEANISHAVFFNWWSYKNTPNKRHARSQYEWWGKLKRSSAFIYLIEKHGYPMRPPTINDVDFWEFLEKPPIHQTILRDFFSKYAFITQQLEDETLVAISAGPLPIDVKPFSEDEIAVLDAYEHHYEEMN